MEIPAEFKALVRRLNATELPSPFVETTWIANALDRFDLDTAQTVRIFLGDLLGSGATSRDLQDVWHSARSEFLMSDADLRTFLGLVLQALQKTEV